MDICLALLYSLLVYIHWYTYMVKTIKIRLIFKRYRITLILFYSMKLNKKQQRSPKLGGFFVMFNNLKRAKTSFYVLHLTTE
ncbi:MAG: hypothetical protein ACJAYB_001337 [Psychromonas sp.]|jgi:hypothetical protein